MKHQRKRFFFLLLASSMMTAFLPLNFSIAKEASQAPAEGTDIAKLTLIGHASVKIKTAEGVVIYIDPYAPGDYGEKADIILVSHEHSDHNKIDMCTQNEGCIVLRVKDTINKKDKTYNVFEHLGVQIQPVPAFNKNHKIDSTNGFVLTFDSIKVYHAADTSRLDEMADLSYLNIDYALYPIDGKYNMGAAEAMDCAVMVGAKHNTPMHYFDADPAAFTPENLLLIPYGETVELTASPEEDEQGQ